MTQTRDRSRCTTCGHLAGYHGGPNGCLGSKQHPVGFFVSNDDRCGCPLTPEEARTTHEE